MNDKNIPADLPPSFRAGRKLRGHVPMDFERFYREHLRYWPGGRIGALALSDRYQAWALATGAEALGLRALRRAMSAIGHANRNSNGRYYADVRLAVDLPDVPDNYPDTPPPPPSTQGALVDRLDQMLTELTAIRAEAVRLSDGRGG